MSIPNGRSVDNALLLSISVKVLTYHLIVAGFSFTETIFFIYGKSTIEKENPQTYIVLMSYKELKYSVFDNIIFSTGFSESK